jgi:hypothetical protein
MSANDLIMIAWDGKRYKITRRDADNFRIISKIGQLVDISDAIKFAQTYEEQEIHSSVEYGYHFKLKPKKLVITYPGK